MLAVCAGQNRCANMNKRHSSVNVASKSATWLESLLKTEHFISFYWNHLGWLLRLPASPRLAGHMYNSTNQQGDKSLCKLSKPHPLVMQVFPYRTGLFLEIVPSTTQCPICSVSVWNDPAVCPGTSQTPSHTCLSIFVSFVNGTDEKPRTNGMFCADVIGKGRWCFCIHTTGYSLWTFKLFTNI